MALDWLRQTLESLRDKVEGLDQSIVGRVRQEIDNVRSEIDSVKTVVGDAINDGLNSLRETVSGIPDAIRQEVDRLRDKADQLTDRIVSRISQEYGDLRDTFTSTVNSLKGSIRSAVDAFVQATDDLAGRLAAKVAGLANSVLSGMQEIADGIRQKVSDLAQAVIDQGNAIADRVKAGIEGLVSGIREAYQVAEERIRQAIQSALEKISEALNDVVAWLDRIYDDVAKAINEHVIRPLQTSAKDLKDIVDFKGEVLRKAAMGEYATFDDFINDLADPPPAIAAVAATIGGLVMWMVVAPAVGAALEPAFANISHLAAEKFRPALLSPSESVTAYFRGYLDDAELHEQLSKQGIPDRVQHALIQAARPILTVEQARAAYLRGIISEDQHDRILRQHGYTDEDINRLKDLYWMIPSPSDLISMAVREAFNPEAIQEFGLLQDFPEEFAIWAEKQGISREWAERYWAAHWRLPSVEQGFEMLHRGVIDQRQLDMLMRALDIVPAWREKLTQISYRPFTRVDVRRMYQLGILDREGVKRAYLDLGYDEEKAEAMTEFTIRYTVAAEETEADDRRNLTRSLLESAYKRGIIDRDELINRLEDLGYVRDDAELIADIIDAKMAVEETDDVRLPLRSKARNAVLSAYRRGAIDRSEASAMLTDLGYTEREVDAMLNYEDFDTFMDLYSAQIETVHSMYVRRVIDRVQAISMLGQLNLTHPEQERLLNRWDVERELRDRKPTRSELERFLRKGVIDEATFREEMRGLGYADKYIDWYLASLSG